VYTGLMGNLMGIVNLIDLGVDVTSQMSYGGLCELHLIGRSWDPVAGPCGHISVFC
jgi:hypothetical protein